MGKGLPVRELEPAVGESRICNEAGKGSQAASRERTGCARESEEALDVQYGRGPPILRDGHVQGSPMADQCRAVKQEMAEVVTVGRVALRALPRALHAKPVE